MTALRPRVLVPGLLALVLAAGAGHARAESRLQAYHRLRDEAQAAMKAGDPGLAEARLTQAMALFPHHPGLLLRLAQAQAARGETAAVGATLLRLAREGPVFDITTDPALAKLAARPELAPAAAAFAANRLPQGRLMRVEQVAGAARPLEGVAFDPVRRRLLVSAVGGRRVLVRTEGGWRPFGDVAEGGLFGMAIDAKARRLWIAEAAGPAIPGAHGPAATALLCLDLDDGHRIARYPLEPGADRQLGDVTIGPDGGVYASDAAGGGVYRLRPGGTRLETLATSDEMGSPQGLVVVDGGRALIVADYPSGLHRIDLATGAVAPLAEPENVTLATIDGLAADGADLIATQNGDDPQRVLRIRLAAGGRRIASVKVLLANPKLDAGAADLSLGTVAGTGPKRAYVFVARSGWASVDDKGDMPRADADAPATLGWISLGR